ncbi:MAG: hypothetical protein HC916_15670 [Coleofasciculaceae cyanobacterium SM2_1_6]|nr:hypothetical protein [Coleofasciculaceae cyanobacterium SM2_1_6]
MRSRNSEWQGNFGYWQQDFIHENMLVIGYYAWQGFMEFGRGIVSLQVDLNTAKMRTNGGDRELINSQFNYRFIGRKELSSQMQEYNFDPESIEQLLFVIDNYDPQQDIIVLLIANNHPEINLLRDLKISPQECDRQVRRRWAEFQPC